MIGSFVACVVVLLGTSADEPGSVNETRRAYEASSAATGRSAEAQVRLALWCEAHGFEREKLKHLAVAVLTDPSHAMARSLLGLVEYRGKWLRPEAVAELTRADVEAADLQVEYRVRRLRTPVKVEPQYKLALWCVEKGLAPEASAHLATVVSLDPNHVEARKRLGYKRIDGRWLTDADAAALQADRDLQKKADKAWHPRLVQIRDSLASVSALKRDEARRNLAAVADPRAVPSVWQVFVEKVERHHRDAVQILGQIDAGDASRGLAVLALSSKDPEARRQATETLRRRDPREYAGLLIGRLREKIKYDVKPVGGPGEPGSLFIEGKYSNLKRLYTPGQPPRIEYGDQLDYDAQGRVIARRALGGPIRTLRIEVGAMTDQQFAAALALNQTAIEYQKSRPHSFNPFDSQLGGWSPPPPPTIDPAIVDRLSRVMGPQAGPHAAELSKTLVANVGNLPFGNRATATRSFPMGRNTGYTFDMQRTITIPVEQLAADASRSAAIAQEQLRGDVQILEGVNREIDALNRAPAAILSAATGESFGDDRKAWETWFVNQIGYAYRESAEFKPTEIENIPIAYQPTAAPRIDTQILRVTRMSCFGKGTPVQTIDGPRPIESLNVGDRVLTQSTKTGKLGYHPILVVHRNPPSPTYRVALDGQPVVTSHFHRFWKAGRGWVMARDLKVGDSIRTLGGLANVTTIEVDQVQPVFNLDVADDADFFAGTIAALVHDNTLPDLRQEPFDAPAGIASR